ncbi:dihydrofolate reductase [Pseudoclavibacter endophyticus]|uniref:Hydroxyacid dehydrogenase n=1 Tax=Pseudoclavibacter endophyticus TaxID=1778590 RepID=A0A6H9WUU0_9MICO|nr:NAD(P)-dependent oxidoreductase [Pseudoclavibacter endophyticus]KAB1649960.1 hydroxyacid dehydrogenase [Pseudoclavibacter endophyticus]GGA58393.1 dihydrofolate reductase [Pseudoclavibacter endophyticus]
MTHETVQTSKANRTALAYSHRSRTATEAELVGDDRRPAVGAVTILPADRGLAGGESVLEAAGATLVPLGDETRGLIFTSPRDVDGLIDALERHPQISWVQLPFAGIDHFADRLKPHAERGVFFTSAKGAYAQPVAEHALALALALQRQLPMRARATSWGRQSGLSLYGANALILGAGGICLELIDLMRPFGVTVTVGRRLAAQAVPGADRTVDLDGFRAAIPEADVIVLAAAATGATRHVIADAELRAMKQTAVLVNIARGPLIDTEALVRALDDEQLFGAGLDVTDPEPLPDDHPLFSHERAIITPHSADTPDMIKPLFLERCRANVEAFLSSGRFIGVADPVLGY